MEQTWRWWGPSDTITLANVRQAGAHGVVTALHDIPYGEVWSEVAIRERQHLITCDASLGLRWSVVESLPVHEAIKIGGDDLEPLFENYRRSMHNLAACGIQTICYNFMPVLDWTRTDTAWPIAGGGRALRFDAARFAAFDCLMLERKGAAADHDPAVLARGRAWFDKASDPAKQRLLADIMAGLPGAFDRYGIVGLRSALARYRGIDAAALFRNYVRFLEAVVPTAEGLGLRLAVHPDDPPRPLLGLPRIVSTEEQIAAILEAVPSPANGLTLCTGSLGAHPANDICTIARRFAGNIHFAHLRNVSKEPDGSFQESDHLGGDNDMVAVVAVLLAEQSRRKNSGRSDWRIPFRPDHGHELADDIGKPTHPGYPLIGRLRGLAEIRGVMTALAHQHAWPT